MYIYVKQLKKELGNIMNNSIGRSMLLSMLCKVSSMSLMLIYTPILLRYLGEEAYGVWATVLSIVNWINYFDIGIGNGMRNILTIHIARNEDEEVRKDVSTAYVAISFISLIVFFIGTIFIMKLDEHAVFKTELDIKFTFVISFLFVCINFVLSLSKILLYVIQQAEKVNGMTFFTQAINLCGILILSFLGKKNILYVAILVGMSGLVINLFFSIRIWNKYHSLMPHIKFYAKDRLQNICGVGIKFFLIQICGIILYSTDNIIIIQLFGASSVTPYQTAHSAFGVVNTLYTAAISPLWAQYTVAKEQQNYEWIKKIIKKSEKLMLIIGIVLLAECIFYKPIAVIWLQKKLYYDNGLIIMMAIYNFVYIWTSIYSIACNGMGRINLQLYLSIVGAILNIPLSFFFGNLLNMRSTGVLLATIICMLIAIIPMVIDVQKFLNKMCMKKENAGYEKR